MQKTGISKRTLTKCSAQSGDSKHSRQHLPNSRAAALRLGGLPRPAGGFGGDRVSFICGVTSRAQAQGPPCGWRVCGASPGSALSPGPAPGGTRSCRLCCGHWRASQDGQRPHYESFTPLPAPAGLRGLGSRQLACRNLGLQRVTSGASLKSSRGLIPQGPNPSPPRTSSAGPAAARSPVPHS